MTWRAHQAPQYVPGIGEQRWQAAGALDCNDPLRAHTLGDIHGQIVEQPPPAGSESPHTSGGKTPGMAEVTSSAGTSGPWSISTAHGIGRSAKCGRRVSAP